MLIRPVVLSGLLDLDTISAPIVLLFFEGDEVCYINYMYFDKKNCAKKFRSQLKRKPQTSWQNGVNCVGANLPFNSQSVNLFR